MIDLTGPAWGAVKAVAMPWQAINRASDKAAAVAVTATSRAGELAKDKALESMGLGPSFAASLGASAGKWVVILVALAAGALFVVEAVKSAARKVVA